MAYTLSSSTFSISSPMVIKNGTEGYGKILTTDASGLVQWKEPNSFFGTSRYIGEFYGGGIVVDFWKEGDAENTLIMSLTHLSFDYVWSNVPSVTGEAYGEISYSTNAYSLYDGKYNSNLITSQIVYNNFPPFNIATSHTISAAKLCKDYNYGGYEDWYLPSYNEFNSIIKNKHIINRVLGDFNGIRSQNTGSGSALSGLYWTSTEFEDRFTSTEEIFPGGPIQITAITTQYGIQYSTSESKFKTATKTSNAMVRAIRREEKITGNGLVLSLDAGNKNSYDDTTKGNIWYDLVNKGITASAGLTFSTSATGATYSATNSGYISFQNNTTSFIDFKADLGNTTVVTVEIFARIKNTYGNIFTWGTSGYSIFNGWELGFHTGGGDNYGISAQRKSDYGLENSWKHYVFVMRTDVSYTNNKIYVNGDLITLSVSAFGGTEGVKSFANGTGRINPPNAGNTNGNGMDLAILNIYKRELNQTEIVNNFNKYKKRFEVKESVYQKDLILNVNSNNINSFNPSFNPTTWYDSRMFADLSINPSKHLTFASTANYTKSPGVYPGTSINFDGINRASVATTITFNPSTTWETWVKFDSFDINAFNMFMGQVQPYFSIRTTVSNKVMFSNSYSGIVGSTATQSYQFSNSSVVANVWYHLAFTTKYDSVSNTTSSKIYINGLPDYSNSIPTNGLNTYDSNSIPGYQLNNYPNYKFTVGDGSDLFPNVGSATWYPFRGSISEVRIYNRTLSALEIENNYNSSKHLYDIDQNHFTHNFNTSPTFSIFQNLTLDFPNKQNNSILVSDNKGQVSLSTPTSLIFGKTNKKSVGELYAGGIIVSVVDYLSTRNYLIASLEDLPSAHYWSTLDGSLPGSPTGTNEFNGTYNTSQIKTSLGVGSYAAMTASVYNYGGYTDWYLPSSNELREAYNNSNVLNLVLGKNSLSDTYWSSSESLYGDGEVFPNAFAFNFGSVVYDLPSDLPGLGVLGTTSSGLELLVGKYNQLKVRPFRKQIDGNDPFVTVWKTDNVGFTGTNQIRLPTIGGANYNVDWGDGTTSSGVTGIIIHTYPTPGTYTVKITGVFTGFNFSSSTDQLKLLQVKNWGSIKWSRFDYAFTGCENLTITATDAPDLTAVTNMERAFSGCISLNQSINHWNVSNVVNMHGLFLAATTFNQPLSNWDTSKVTNMSSMFLNAWAFNQSIDSWNVSLVQNMSYMFSSATVFNQPLNSWNTPSLTFTSYMFLSAPVFNQPLSNWITSGVTNMVGMFANARAFNQPLITVGNKWNVSAVQSMATMFLGAWAFNQSLNSWNTLLVISMQEMFKEAKAFNNGLISGATGALNLDTHLVGLMNGMFQNAIAFNQTLTPSGNVWNTSAVTNMSYMFSGASVFNQSITLNTTSVTDMTAMFQQATQFNNSFSPGVVSSLNIDTHSVKFMTSMFAQASSFNQSLTPSGNIWNTSVVESMSAMFAQASVFNRPLNTWNTSAVTNMQSMFAYASAFNQPLNSWNTSVVKNMANMFQETLAFNQPLTTSGNSWNTSAVITMRGMFDGADVFNQNIGSWNTSEVTTMERMFAYASVFNNGLAPGVSGSAFNWNTFSLTTTHSMFLGARSFNQPLTTSGNIWNMSKNIEMTFMFAIFDGSTSVFNQPLNTWNTSLVFSMYGMFANAVVFNQPLNNWNTSSVIYMHEMFKGATAFNQNIGSWNVSNVINFYLFMSTKTNLTFSSANLDAIYIGWASRPVKPNNGITFGTAKRTAASTAARGVLTASPNFWTITDAGI